MKPEKSLSIKQPYASLIALGIKDVENRTWKTNFRGRIYIHASAKIDNFNLTDEQLKQCGLKSIYESYNLTSSIIGEVDIVDCRINYDSIWAEKSDWYSSFNGGISAYVGRKERNVTYNWVLANPVMYDKPILNVKGKLSFWNFDPLNP